MDPALDNVVVLVAIDVAELFAVAVASYQVPHGVCDKCKGKNKIERRFGKGGFLAGGRRRVKFTLLKNCKIKLR